MECINQGIFHLDGGTNTYLQEQGLAPGELPETWNLLYPEEIRGLHRQYYETGGYLVCTNIFGADGLRHDKQEDRFSVKEVVSATVNYAKTAREETKFGQPDRFVALDTGPLGKLLAPLGDLDFGDTVSLFAEVVQAGTEAGVDRVLVEIINDCYGTKAAVLAVEENCSLPVFVSNVYGETGKLMSGTTPEAVVAMLEGLDADVIDISRSLGPDKILKLLPRFIPCASIPVLVKSDARLPRSEGGKTVFDASTEEFVQTTPRIVAGEVRVIGGYCGTTSAYIKLVTDQTRGLPVTPILSKHRTVISSYIHAVIFGGEPVTIDKRINPTGKKRFKEALRQKDIGHILKEGILQQKQGAQVLDINMGLPEIGEPEMLVTCMKELQGVCDLSLQLGTSNQAAMGRTMRVYNDKPVINSVNGSDESMSTVFPLVKEYGGFVVCPTLDGFGIPKTAEERFVIAERIVRRAMEYGIAACDLIFDPLAITISSDQQAVQVTLDTIPMTQGRLGVCCSLGISSTSFDLPNRDFVTGAFFIMTLVKGLSAAIMNPFSFEVQKAYHSYLALAGLDDNYQEYVRFSQNTPSDTVTVSKTPAVQNSSQTPDGLQSAILRGLSAEAAELAREELESVEPLALIREQTVSALSIVGKGFEAKTVFLPQLLMSAEVTKATFEEVRKKLPASDEIGPAIILTTVKGDIHDIGKDIAKAIMENYGYHVIDFGKDVLPETIVESAIENQVKLVGLNALMTTTIPAMAGTIRQLKKKKLDTPVMVGGAVMTQGYADQVGADFYRKNTIGSVGYAERVLKGKSD